MKNLFDETKLGGVTLRNRAWRSATWLGLAGRNGEITNGIIRTYAELAKGGAAMLVTGLRHMQAFGGAGDVFLLRNGKKVSEYP